MVGCHSLPFLPFYVDVSCASSADLAFGAPGGARDRARCAVCHKSPNWRIGLPGTIVLETTGGECPCAASKALSGTPSLDDQSSSLQVRLSLEADNDPVAPGTGGGQYSAGTSSTTCSTGVSLRSRCC
jgi:hypothetical protein